MSIVPNDASSRPAATERVSARSGKIFAYVVDNVIREIIPEISNFADEWHADFVASCTEITSDSPMPEVGWVLSGDTFSAPPPVVLPPALKMSNAQMAGCDVISTGTPSLNGTYDAIGPRWQMMRDEALHIAIFSEFSGGLTAIEWTALSGTITFTTTAEFLNVVKGIAGWVTLWQGFVDGKLSDAPTLPVTVV